MLKFSANSKELPHAIVILSRKQKNSAAAAKTLVIEWELGLIPTDNIILKTISAFKDDKTIVLKTGNNRRPSDGVRLRQFLEQLPCVDSARSAR